MRKPLKSAERIICASSQKDDLVIDFSAAGFFLAAEMLRRRCYTIDIDPIVGNSHSPAWRFVPLAKPAGKTAIHLRKMYFLPKTLARLVSRI
jgi:hypothetical protein